MLAILEEQSDWLEDILVRARTWQPSFGDVAIIGEEVHRAEVLLQEAGSHDSSMQYLADSKPFVVDHSLVVDRPWADDEITVSRRRGKGDEMEGKRWGREREREEGGKEMGREGELEGYAHCGHLCASWAASDTICVDQSTFLIAQVFLCACIHKCAHTHSGTTGSGCVTVS